MHNIVNSRENYLLFNINLYIFRVNTSYTSKELMKYA